ncbi:MAG: three-helix bundle dimerization domain-containing protein [Terrabacter sp.]
MDPHHEAAEIRNVQARLAERFPDLDPGIVETAVAAAHAELTGNIRDFVPVLVEHGARDRLSAIVRGDAANGVTGPVT